MGTAELAVVGMAGSGLGTVMAVPMMWPRTDHPSSARLMGGWLIAVSALVFLISARLVGVLPATAAVDHTINLLGLSAYPLLYLYIREQTRHTAMPCRAAVWLWLPMTVYLGVLFVRAALGARTDVPFAWLLPVLLLFTVACGHLVVTRHPPRGPALVPAEWIVGFLVALNAAQIARFLYGHIAPVPALVPLVLTIEFAVIVSVVFWRSVEARPAVAAPEPPAPRYERSGLDADAAHALLARIDLALTGNRLFADQALTLARLAAAINSTPHQVSESLNRHRGITFHELLNQLRVDDVKAQLRDASAVHYTIEGIGASAGFGSRSALYAAFRRLEGMTPADYRKRHAPQG